MFFKKPFLRFNSVYIKNLFSYNKHNKLSINNIVQCSIKNQWTLQNWLNDYSKLQTFATVNDIYKYELLKSRLQILNNDELDSVFELPNIKIKSASKAFIIKINNLKYNNALNLDMYEGITEALNYSLEDRTTSITVLTGEGEFFSNGNNFVNLNDFSLNRYLKIYEKFMLALIDHDKPLVGLINGPAIGIMAETLPLFDYVLASDKAYFKTLAVEKGHLPGGCSTFTFPQLIGKNASCDFLTRGQSISAMEGKNLGLVNSVIRNRFFIQAAERKVKQFSKIPPINLIVIKKLFRDNIRKDLYQCLSKEKMFLSSSKN